MIGAPAPADRRLATLRRSLVPLRQRNFALFWIGYLVSNGGRWMELTGAVWLLSELTSSPILLGLVGVARALPNLLLTPMAGVIADRVDQRRLLFWTQASSVAASMLLAILIVSGAVEVWHVYVQVTLQSAIGAFDATVRQALFPRLVPREQLPEAVTLHSTATRLCQLLGPAIGGLAIAVWGDATPFALNAASSFVLMGALVGIHGVVPRTATAGSTMRGELVDGLRYMLATPIIAGLLTLELVSGLFQVNPVMITIFGREVLGVGPEGLGGLLSAGAVGAIVGIGYLLVAGQAERQGRFVVVSMLVYAGLMVVTALTRDYLACFVMLAAIGFFDSLTSVTRQNVMQLAAPGRMRGRVMANVGTITRGTGPLAQTFSGLLASVLGPSVAIVASAAVSAAAAAGVGRTSRTVWHASRHELIRHRPGPAARAHSSVPETIVAQVVTAEARETSG